MSKKENKIIVFYNEIEQRNKYRLNGVDITDTIECLLEAHEKEIVDTKCKLFQLDMTIQQRLQDQLALTEKALEKSYEYHKKHSTPADWIYHISKEEYVKEMMKSE